MDIVAVAATVVGTTCRIPLPPPRSADCVTCWRLAACSGDSALLFIFVRPTGPVLLHFRSPSLCSTTSCSLSLAGRACWRFRRRRRRFGRPCRSRCCCCCSMVCLLCLQKLQCVCCCCCLRHDCPPENCVETFRCCSFKRSPEQDGAIGAGAASLPVPAPGRSTSKSISISSFERQFVAAPVAAVAAVRQRNKTLLPKQCDLEPADLLSVVLAAALQETTRSSAFSLTAPPEPRLCLPLLPFPMPSSKTDTCSMVI